jgi:hypothetical protein
MLLFLTSRLILLSAFCAKRPQAKYKAPRHYSLLARGEAECNDAGLSYDIVQCLLAAIRNHEPSRTSFCLKGFYYCVLHFRKIN